MKTNKELRAQALASLKGNWGPAVLLSLILLAISGVSSFVPGVSLIVSFLVGLPLSVGVYEAFRRLVLGEKVQLIDYSFNLGFNNWKHNVLVMLLMTIYTMLWSLLLIVPGIIKSLSYALTPYIVAEKPELSANESIELSMKMMDGHKMDLFLIILGFIGLAVLSIFTLCIGYLWLAPYMYAKMAAFYEDVKAEYESKNVAA